MYKLSLLIPVRTNEFDFYRRRLVLRDALNLKGVETIVIDDGSPINVAGEIERFCIDRSYRYLRLNSEGLEFSLARSRNIGMREARSAWVYMEDADLIYCRDFFQNFISQLELLGETPFNFLSIPAVYLTEEASDKVYDEGGVDSSYRSLINSLLLEDPKGASGNSRISSFAPASGVIAVKKDLGLALGGYDEAFSGWGGEDRDFIFRLLCANNKIKFPAHFSETKSWNLNDTVAFEGWRSLHRLIGDFMGRQGFYAFHLYHETLPWRVDASSAKNMKLAASKASAFDQAASRDSGRFDLRYTVLFDNYRCYDLLDPSTREELLARRMSLASKARDKVQGKARPFQRKLRKLLISPLQYFEDSGSPLLIRLARLARRK